MSGIPLAYRLFFLYIEPLSALAGAYYSIFEPHSYLKDLAWSPDQTMNEVPSPHHTVTASLAQLGNLYLLFALNEHFVLSSTPSLRVWKTLLAGLLVADIGHVATVVCYMPGSGWDFRKLDVLWQLWGWNAMMWGSVGFVYLGAIMRICFLSNVGLKTAKRGQRKKKT